ncbi:MAG: outer membrane beta-barrel protein [Chitinophagaceae bacterium]
MKSILILIAAILLVTYVAHSQENKIGGIGIGLRGGVNFQTINGKKSNGDKLSNDILTGFNAGINVDIPIGPSFSLQPGVVFSTKGAKTKEVVQGQNINSTIKISYLEIPLYFIFKPVLGTSHLLLGFGPYVAFGVGGKATYDALGIKREEKVRFKNDVKLTDADDVTYFKALDAGANLLAGYELTNGVSFQLNAQLGLTNINPTFQGTSSNKPTAKNTGFGLSVGYRF